MNYPVKALGSLTSPSALAAAYAAADAVVLPTLEDNLPNVLLEALACGTPAVAFNVGGIPDILDHMETGYLAKARDADDLAEGLLWALRPHPFGHVCAAPRLLSDTRLKPVLNATGSYIRNCCNIIRCIYNETRKYDYSLFSFIHSGKC